tara:strand:+ start:71 stop:547 length:477 start_codon:yes stop_codon:yes gene_type:complete
MDESAMTAKAFDYDDMVQHALKGVVKETLKRVALEGLPGFHHFYITFQTNRPDVKIPSYLKDKHSNEITIVLQHQFWDLKIDDEGFDVSLSFNDNQEHIRVPFNALINFLDPHVKFGLQFTPEMPSKTDKTKQKKKVSSEPSKETLTNVVTLDTFRKK